MAEYTTVVKERRRMCKEVQTCNKCPISAINNKTKTYCDNFMSASPEEADRIIMQWSKDHPVMTNRRKFEEVFGHNIASMLETSCRNSACLSAWLDEEYKEKIANE